MPEEERERLSMLEDERDGLSMPKDEKTKGTG
jgi:hypothetical protein